MPKINGKDTCDAIRKNRPDLKAIFLGGHTPDVVQQKLVLEPGTTVLFKPLSPGDLLRKVREILDRKA